MSHISIQFSWTASCIINILGSAEPTVMTRLTSAHLRCADMLKLEVYVAFRLRAGGVTTLNMCLNDLKAPGPSLPVPLTQPQGVMSAGGIEVMLFRCLVFAVSPCRRTCRTMSRRSSPPSPSPVPAVPLWCVTCSGPWGTWPPSGSQVGTSLHRGIVGQDRVLGSSDNYYFIVRHFG
jgi:hypothetical protein